MTCCMLEDGGASCKMEMEEMLVLYIEISIVVRLCRSMVPGNVGKASGQG